MKYRVRLGARWFDHLVRYDKEDRSCFHSGQHLYLPSPIASHRSPMEWHVCILSERKLERQPKRTLLFARIGRLGNHRANPHWAASTLCPHSSRTPGAMRKCPISSLSSASPHSCQRLRLPKKIRNRIQYAVTSVILAEPRKIEPTWLGYVFLKRWLISNRRQCHDAVNK